MHRITEAQPLDGHRVRLRFDDGSEGVVDFGPLAARGGIYAGLALAPRAVSIGPRGRSLEWPSPEGTVDFCADALRLEIEQQRAAAE
jgi:hypothetical protein